MVGASANYFAKPATGIKPVLWQLAFPLLVAYALIPLSFLIPSTNATRPPFFNLNSWFALCAYGITATGDLLGAALTGILMLVILATRAATSWKHRLRETGIVLGWLVLMAGGGAALNEYVLKPALAFPRPNIVYLAGVDGSGPLKMPAQKFYALEKEIRRQHLRTVLETNPAPVVLHHKIREHWIATSGHSMPSGHAFTAMFFATFFLALGLSWLSGSRLGFFYFLLPWAVAVCHSRVILSVHNPIDIFAGGTIGIALGVLAFMLTRASVAALRRAAAAQVEI